MKYLLSCAALILALGIFGCEDKAGSVEDASAPAADASADATVSPSDAGVDADATPSVEE